MVGVGGISLVCSLFQILITLLAVGVKTYGIKISEVSRGSDAGIPGVGQTERDEQHLTYDKSDTKRHIFESYY